MDGLLMSRIKRGNCSQCLSGNCKTNTGICEDCNPGYLGPRCDVLCPFGTFGWKCHTRCPTTCDLDNACHHVTGACLDGCVAGYSGLHCNETCDMGFFGKNCAGMCSFNCVDYACYPSSGQCFSCKFGRTGLYCDEISVSHKPGEMSLRFVVTSLMGIFALGLSFWAFLGCVVVVKNLLVRNEVRKSGVLPPRWVTRYSNYRGMFAVIHGRKNREANQLRGDAENLILRGRLDSKTSVSSAARKRSKTDSIPEKNNFLASLFPIMTRAFANKPRFPRRGSRSKPQQNVVRKADSSKTCSNIVQIPKSQPVLLSGLSSPSEHIDCKSHSEENSANEKTSFSISLMQSSRNINDALLSSQNTHTIDLELEDSTHSSYMYSGAYTHSSMGLTHDTVNPACDSSNPSCQESFRSEESTGDNVSGSVFDAKKSRSSSYSKQKLTASLSKCNTPVKNIESNAFVKTRDQMDPLYFERITHDLDKAPRVVIEADKVREPLVCNESKWKGTDASPGMQRNKGSLDHFETTANGDPDGIPSSAVDSHLQTTDTDYNRLRTGGSSDTIMYKQGILSMLNSTDIISYGSNPSDFTSYIRTETQFPRIKSNVQKEDTSPKQDESIHNTSLHETQQDETMSLLSFSMSQDFSGSDFVFNQLKYTDKPRILQSPKLTSSSDLYYSYGASWTANSMTATQLPTSPTAFQYATDQDMSSTTGTVGSSSSTSTHTMDATDVTSYKESEYTSQDDTSPSEKTTSSEESTEVLDDRSSDISSPESSTYSKTVSKSQSMTSVISLDQIKQVPHSRFFQEEPADLESFRNKLRDVKMNKENSNKSGVDKATETLPASVLKASKSVKWGLTRKFTIGDSPDQKCAINEVMDEKENNNEKEDEHKGPTLATTRHFSGTFLMSRFALWEKRERGDNFVNNVDKVEATVGASEVSAEDHRVEP